MPHPVYIAPSILAADFSRLAEALQALETNGADWVHVDVMDGHFVPNLTIGPPVIASLRKETTLPLDVHLMIEHPDASLPAYAAAGADGLTVHWEACTHLHRTVQTIHQLGCLAGVSLNPVTPVSVLEEIINDIDLVLLMSVNPGFGGQSFIPSTLAKLQKLTALVAQHRNATLPPLHIQVDGGVGLPNCADIINAGANTLVAGSAVFNSTNPAQTIHALRATASKPTQPFLSKVFPTAWQQRQQSAGNAPPASFTGGCA